MPGRCTGAALSSPTVGFSRTPPPATHPHQLAQAPSVADQLLHRTDATPERSEPTSLSFTWTEVSSVHLLSSQWQPPPPRRS